jgi:hypothetical protein
MPAEYGYIQMASTVILMAACANGPNGRRLAERETNLSYYLGLTPLPFLKMMLISGFSFGVGPKAPG